MTMGGPAIEALGGKVAAGDYPFGEYDVLAVPLPRLRWRLRLAAR